ncbi:hypothetical protein AFLA_003961 [Aspergillus flavus NRRL3357]|nr:hypothetical protein AFLA_003961 [Aspergillus flavus NRRL3357]
MVSPRYKRVALVGGGPAGLAAIRELVQEQCFDYIRVFERKDRVGEIWHTNPSRTNLGPPTLTPRDSLPYRRIYHN